MTDINQAILISVVTVITILLTVIGIQVALIFREVRHSIEKINKILDDVGSISGRVVKGIDELGNTASGVKTIVNILRFFRKKDKQKETEEK